MKILKDEALTFNVPLFIVNKSHDIFNPEQVDMKDLISKTQLKKEFKYCLSIEEENKPDAFYYTKGMTGYTSLYKIEQFKELLIVFKQRLGEDK